MSIETIRDGLVCSRCERYVGQLSATTYLPPLYPVAMRDDVDDEGKALIEFEWHLLGMLRQGKFTLAHPELDGRCVSLEEWAESDEADEEDESGIPT